MTVFVSLPAFDAEMEDAVDEEHAPKDNAIIAAAVVFTNVFFILFISFLLFCIFFVFSGWMPVALRRSFIASLLLKTKKPSPNSETTVDRGTTLIAISNK